jgi:hypothetical protein
MAAVIWNGMRRNAAMFLALVGLYSQHVNAQVIRADQKYVESVTKTSRISALSSESFGENIDLQSGAVEFKWTDIDLPGNHELPVILQRSLKVEDRSRGLDASRLGGFGEFGDLDIPHLKGIFSTSGWQVGGSAPNARCTNASNNPPLYSPISAADYWNGNWMHIPWEGSKAMLTDAAPQIPQTALAPTTLVTKDFWRFACKTSTKNGYPGEAFVAISPRGEKYTFDWVVTRPYPTLSKRYANYPFSVAHLDREAVYFLVSRIEDRFGNWVNYQYSGDKLSRIESSDGRFIQIESWEGNKITSVMSSSGRWTYAYTTHRMTVTQPDGADWTLTSSGGLEIVVSDELPLFDGTPRCPPPPKAEGNYGLVVSHPSGASATYLFTVARHFRNNVPRLCNVFVETQTTTYQYLTIPNVDDRFSLISKSISGAGLATQTWSYEYSGGSPLAFRTCATTHQRLLHVRL